MARLIKWMFIIARVLARQTVTILRRPSLSYSTAIELRSTRVKWRNLRCSRYLYISKSKYELFRKLLSPVYQTAKRVERRTNFRFHESHVEIRNQSKSKVICYQVEVRTGPCNETVSSGQLCCSARFEPRKGE